MRIAVLVKQIPALDELELGANGRLARVAHDLEMNPYCRRAVAQATDWAERLPGQHHVTVCTMGPPPARDVLREALVWCRDRGVNADAVLLSDPALAGSDTLVTARAIATLLEALGPFDVVFTGRNSVDADTGHVAPQLAAFLGLPFIPGVREISCTGATVRARCELDDGWSDVECELPAVVSCAERLIDPCKVESERRATVPDELVRAVDATILGPGPWGADASPTWVGELRPQVVDRERAVFSGANDEGLRAAVQLLRRRRALGPPAGASEPGTLLGEWQGNLDGPAVVVVAERERVHATRELVGVSAAMAASLDGHVVVFDCGDEESNDWAIDGVDGVIAVRGSTAPLDVAAGLADWASLCQPWAILLPSTTWGREVAARAAVTLRAGLVADAVGLELRDGRLTAWKSAFGGQLLAEIGFASSIQMATVRVGVLPLPEAPPTQPTRAVRTHELRLAASLGVRVLTSGRDDNLDVLGEAPVVVAVGAGVEPRYYHELDELLALLDAQMGATRKVTDRGWLPRSRQVGITGRSVSPRLFVSIGASGKFNHMVGAWRAGTVLAVNVDPDAPVFQAADVGLVGDWRQLIPCLVAALRDGEGAEAGSTREVEGSDE